MLTPDGGHHLEDTRTLATAKAEDNTLDETKQPQLSTRRLVLGMSALFAGLVIQIVFVIGLVCNYPFHQHPGAITFGVFSSVVLLFTAHIALRIVNRKR